MGDPKKPKKSYRRPRRIWTADQLSSELYVIGSYGLRNKRELWKAHTELSRVRKQARSLLALTQELREKKEPTLMKSLSKVGFVRENSTLDDVLNLKVTDLLSRRLQTMVQKKGLIKSPYQARQAVVHGHVMIRDRVVTIPSYIVKLDEENEIHFVPGINYGQPKKQEVEAVITEQPQV